MDGIRHWWQYIMEIKHDILSPITNERISSCHQPVEVLSLTLKQLWFEHKMFNHERCWATIISWYIWKMRNDLIFNPHTISFFSQTVKHKTINWSYKQIIADAWPQFLHRLPKRNLGLLCHVVFARLIFG